MRFECSKFSVLKIHARKFFDNFHVNKIAGTGEKCIVYRLYSNILACELKKAYKLVRILDGLHFVKMY